jgi:hypothetical protein
VAEMYLRWLKYDKEDLAVAEVTKMYPGWLRYTLGGSEGVFEDV